MIVLLKGKKETLTKNGVDEDTVSRDIRQKDIQMKWFVHR